MRTLRDDLIAAGVIVPLSDLADRRMAEFLAGRVTLRLDRAGKLAAAARVARGGFDDEYDSGRRGR